MSFATWLIHTCTIQTPTATQTSSGWVENTYPASGHTTGVKCRFIAKLQRYATESIGEQVLSNYKILFPAGTVIDEDAQVTTIVLAATGASVDSDVWRVLEVLPRNAKSQRHITCLLEKVE